MNASFVDSYKDAISGITAGIGLQVSGICALRSACSKGDELREICAKFEANVTKAGALDLLDATALASLLQPYDDVIEKVISKVDAPDLDPLALEKSVDEALIVVSRSLEKIRRYLNSVTVASQSGFAARKTYEEMRRAKRRRLIVSVLALGPFLIALLMMRRCVGGGGGGGYGEVVFEGDQGSAIQGEVRNKSFGGGGNRFGMLMSLDGIDFPVLVTVIKGCDLMDSAGQERDIPIGKRLRILDRKENGILEIDIAGAFYVGHESRIFGKVKIEEVKNKLRFVKPKLESNAEETNKIPAEEERELSVDRGARTAKAKSDKDAEEPIGTLSDEQKKSSADRGAGSAKAELETKIKLARSEFAEVNAEIAAERARWHNALAVINRLTFNKTRPVREASPEYYRCLEASKVIQEVEAGSQKLKAKKARLEAEIIELEK